MNKSQAEKQENKDKQATTAVSSAHLAHLMQSETRYRRLFETARDGMLILNVDTGEITDANPFMDELLGYPPSALLGKELWEIGLFKDRTTNQAAFEHLLETGYARYDNLPLKTRQGEKREVEFVSNVYTEGDARVIQCNIRDITERRQREEEGRKNLEMLQAIKEGTTDAIFIKDVEGHYLLINSAGAQFLGVTPEEAIGRKDSELFDEESVERIRENDLRALEAGILNTYESSGTAAGMTRTYLSMKAPYRDSSGNIIGVVGISRDITELKRLQKEMIRSERLAAMGALVSGVAHEINNPLAAISGQAQLLQMHPDPQVQKDGQAIKQMTDRATRIVRSLLTFARQTSISDRVSKPLRPLIEETLEIVRYNLRASDVEVIRNLDGPEMFSVVNPGQIEQVLLNLINNGIYALQKRPNNRTLAITTLKTFQAGREWATITISDNGPGISQKVIDHIFDPFFTTKPQGEGTGLGLSICHGIVEEHEGRLEVVSVDGIGATFMLTLPLMATPNVDGSVDVGRK